MLVEGRNRVRALCIALEMNGQADSLELHPAGLRHFDPVVEVFGPGIERRAYGLSAEGVPILLGTVNVR
jgi:hypothetical protein